MAGAWAAAGDVVQKQVLHSHRHTADFRAAAAKCTAGSTDMAAEAAKAGPCLVMSMCSDGGQRWLGCACCACCTCCTSRGGTQPRVSSSRCRMASARAAHHQSHKPVLYTTQQAEHGWSGRSTAILALSCSCQTSQELTLAVAGRAEHQLGLCGRGVLRS